LPLKRLSENSERAERGGDRSGVRMTKVESFLDALVAKPDASILVKMICYIIFAHLSSLCRSRDRHSDHLARCPHFPSAKPVGVREKSESCSIGCLQTAQNNRPNLCQRWHLA
jgi:hypothetical protein